MHSGTKGSRNTDAQKEVDALASLTLSTDILGGDAAQAPGLIADTARLFGVDKGMVRTVRRARREPQRTWGDFRTKRAMRADTYPC